MAIDESTLTKGHLRKLVALRRDVGDELGESKRFRKRRRTSEASRTTGMNWTMG